MLDDPKGQAAGKKDLRGSSPLQEKAKRKGQANPRRETNTEDLENEGNFRSPLPPHSRQPYTKIIYDCATDQHISVSSSNNLLQRLLLKVNGCKMGFFFLFAHRRAAAPELACFFRFLSFFLLWGLLPARRVRGEPRKNDFSPHPFSPP